MPMTQPLTAGRLLTRPCHPCTAGAFCRQRPAQELLLLSDDTSEHVYTMVEELAPDGYLIAESITFKVMQMNNSLVVFIWQDGGWQKSSGGYLAMYDERTDTPMSLMKTFPQTGSIL